MVIESYRLSLNNLNKNFTYTNFMEAQFCAHFLAISPLYFIIIFIISNYISIIFHYYISNIYIIFHSSATNCKTVN